MTDSLHERISAAVGAQYRIEQELGRGGMSVVYRARDVRLNRAVAVKVLPPELAYDTAIGSRFTREAQTSAQLSHPHIVPIYDVGERNGLAFFVMAFITGGNLAARLEAHALRPVDEVRRVLGEVADALAYAHLRGVIHRDIKPDNILIDGESGRAMVTDFGIARAIESDARITQTGIAVGTPAYMSPEQAMGERHIDGRSDLYSLGVLGYQMLTGRLPFTAGNPMALLLKQVNERPRPILELRPDTPKAMAEAIERSLAKSAEDRWPTAAAYREALLAEDTSSSWRGEARERVRYASPVPRALRREAAHASPRSGVRSLPTSGDSQGSSPGDLQLVPPHLAALTPAQSADLRLWGGRIHLLDRVKLIRRYALLTALTTIAGMSALVGVSDVPPLILAPVVPILMGVRLRRLARSLRGTGLKLRRVFNVLRSRNVFADEHSLERALPKMDRALQKLTSREVLHGPRGALLKRAAEDRVAILAIVESLSKPDRALLPEIRPTVDALLERVVRIAEMLRPLDADFDPGLVAELDARIATVGLVPATDERHLSLLRHQRDAMHELGERRAMLARQLESASLALGNLRLDLLKLRSSGVEAGLHDVSTATQEARALSRDIGIAIGVAAEIREL